MTDSRSVRAVLFTSLVLFTAMFGTACLDQESVYGDDRPASTVPPTASQGMIGYVNAEQGLTVCGNCHAQPQAQWSGTKHAGAWEGLQESGHAQEFCESCHAVSQLGNANSVPSGWETTGDPRYLDVQCESCHGPGAEHVADPEAVQPYAALSVLAADGTTYLNCAECHNGTHHPFVEQWSLSGHSQVIGFAAERAECAGCHRGQATLLEWGVRSDYVERDSEEPLPVVCSVCHSAHDATFAGQLRFPVETTSIGLHLCARCHNRRPIPDPNSSHGLAPHSPESELIKGEAGWFPPGSGIAPGAIITSHGSDANPTLCARCHVEPFTVTNPETGDFEFQAVGHTFQAIPCLDENGIPSGATDCGTELADRSWSGCAGECHGSAEQAQGLLTFKVNQVEPLTEELIALLEIVDPNLDEEGGEIDPTDPSFTVAEGAFFNYNLATHGGDVKGSAIHNPRLIPALLEASIEAVEDEYEVALP
ncbi:MAG: hypothetical protein M8835_02635 [marine benthic group bacterium]|nr:hypothetical protein [Gemmatimonadota bacterium]